MKEWAFSDETGYDRITAADALRHRDADGGLTRNVIYFSRHASGTRLRMALVAGQVRKTTPHFAYRRGDAKLAEHRGPPESIHHSLFKQALAALGTVRLTLNGEHHLLQIEGSAIEPRVQAADRLIQPDVAWRFTSDTLLDKKWGCKVYVEVCHTNPVPQPKLEALRAASLPVIEIKIPKNLLFRGGESASTNWQRNYLSFAKDYLENPKHGLEPIMLHDPSSSGYDNVSRQWSADKEAARRAQRNVVTLQAQAERDAALRRSLNELRLIMPTFPRLSTSQGPAYTLVDVPWFKQPLVWTIAALPAVILMGALWLHRIGPTTELAPSDTTFAVASDASTRPLETKPRRAHSPAPSVVHAKRKTKKPSIAALAPPLDPVASPNGWYAINPPPPQPVDADEPATPSEPPPTVPVAQ